MSGGGFVSRWSRRKLAQALAAGQSAAVAPAARDGDAAGGGASGPAADERERAVAGLPAAPAAPLPAPETLSLASDFTAFLREEVDEALRRQALRKLFSDPHFNRMDGLDVYIDDYSVPSPIPSDLMERIRHAQRLLRDAPAEGERDHAAAAPERGAAAATEADSPATGRAPTPDPPAGAPGGEVAAPASDRGGAPADGAATITPSASPPPAGPQRSSAGGRDG